MGSANMASNIERVKDVHERLAAVESGHREADFLLVNDDPPRPKSRSGSVDDATARVARVFRIGRVARVG